MNRRVQQYIAIFVAIALYYIWKLLYPTFLKSFATENNKYGKAEN